MGTLATLWQDHRTLMVFFMVLIVVIPFLIFYLWASGSATTS